MKLLVMMVALVMATMAAKPDKYRSGESRHLQERAFPHYCSGAGLWRCADGQCIQDEWVCDMEGDCFDGSDESNCTKGCTGPHRFQCANGTCISSEYRCDGNSNCDDGSDERDCHLVTCPLGEVKCANEVCVESMWVCDGSDDCTDGSDERNCTQCQRGHFRCASTSTCISGERRCDNKADCQDKSDEAHCDDYSSCRDEHPRNICQMLNQTEHPICLDQRGVRFCPHFCDLCQ